MSARTFKWAAVGLAVMFEAATPVYARGGGHSGAARSSTRTAATGDHAISGYTRRNGTVVQPYHATTSNRTKVDNYSTRGNVNPYTGKAGTKAP